MTIKITQRSRPTPRWERKDKIMRSVRNLRFLVYIIDCSPPKRADIRKPRRISNGMRLIPLFLFIFLYASVASLAAMPAGETHPFSVQDMLAMDRISDPQVSPDGRWIVFVLRKTDLEANLGRTDLWLAGTDGTGLRRLTSHLSKDFNPRWAPDGKTVWFISGRSGSSQVWRIRIDGGEAEQVTDEPLDVGNLLVSPDGKHIAFTMEVFPDCNTPADTKDKLDEIKAKKASGRI